MQNIHIGGAGGAGGAPPPHKQDVLDVITAIDNELVEWILHARPTSDEEKAEMKRVLALRTQIDRQMNQLVLSRMKLATADLRDEAARLSSITTQIRATAKTVATVKEVIAAAGEATGVIAQVVAAIV